VRRGGQAHFLTVVTPSIDGACLLFSHVFGDIAEQEGVLFNW